MLGGIAGSGLLTVSGIEEATIVLSHGRIVCANATGGPRLGELLLETGACGSQDLEAALWVQRQDREQKLLGGVLTEVKLVSPDIVLAAVETQISQILQKLLGWEHGSFRFDRGEFDSLGIIPVERVETHLLRVAELQANASGSCTCAPGGEARLPSGYPWRSESRG